MRNRASRGVVDAGSKRSATGVAVIERMVASLRGRGYPHLEIECEVLPGQYHEAAPPLNLSHSLRYLFDAPR